MAETTGLVVNEADPTGYITCADLGYCDATVIRVMLSAELRASTTDTTRKASEGIVTRKTLGAEVYSCKS